MNQTPEVLFLYRTFRKRRYFEKVCTEALYGIKTSVKSYHLHFPRGNGTVTSRELDELQHSFEREHFHQRLSRSAYLLRKISRPIVRQFIRHIYTGLEHYLSRNEPAVVVLWNGRKFQDQIFHTVNRRFKIPVIYMENGSLPHTTTLDFNGINAGGSIPDHVSAFDNYSDAAPEIGTITGRDYRKKSQPQARPQQYILVPFQTDRDSQILDYSHWISSMRQLHTVCVKALKQSGRDDLHIVFREHPSTRTQYPDLHLLMNEEPRIHFDNSSKLVDAIDDAEAIITINSTVGLEALCRGKQVIVLGQAFYAIDGLVQKAHDVNQLSDAIDKLQHHTMDEALKNRFINYLLSDYFIRGSWRHPNATHMAHFRSKLIQHPRFRDVNSVARLQTDYWYDRTEAGFM